MLTRAGRITKYVQVVTLVLLGGVLFFWSFFDSLLDFTKVAGIITAVMGAIVLYFDERFMQVIRGPSGVITHGTLGHCMDVVLKKHTYVHDMRIMATSSEVIENLIAGHGTRIGTCHLLLRRYPDGPESYNRQVAHTIAEWKGLKSSGHVGELDVALYESVPSEYQVILDDNAVIFGAYAYRPEEEAQAHFMSPSLVLNTSSEASALIALFKEAYDANHATWSAAAP
jgi:hypothetical protein